MPEEVVSFLAATKEITTALSIIAAGFAAAWKWIYLEVQKRHIESEMPSIHGDLEATVTPHGDQSVIVTIGAGASNRSSLPVPIDKDRTRIEVIRIRDEHEFGPVRLDPESAIPISRVYPFEKLGSFRLGTKESYTKNVHFVLKKNQRFLVRWKLYRVPRKGAAHFVNIREMIVNTHLAD